MGKRTGGHLNGEKVIKDGGENRTSRCLTNEIGFAMIMIQYGLVLVSTGRLKMEKLSVDRDHVKTWIKYKR